MWVRQLGLRQRGDHEHGTMNQETKSRSQFEIDPCLCGPPPVSPRQVFYVLEETPCPYLPGRRERKLLTEIAGQDAGPRYALLSRAGFRRSHHFAYRPACDACNACVPVRVVAPEFAPSRSMRRIWSTNRHLSSEERPASANGEQFRLFNRYIQSRHGDGEMSAMSFAEYRGMVEQSYLDSSLIEFREPDGTLVAGCLVDWLTDGPSAVYSFFEPELARHSLGSFMVLWLIRAAQERGLRNVYLGYWIEESQKMAYKARFRPLEGFAHGGWQRLFDPTV